MGQQRFSPLGSHAWHTIQNGGHTNLCPSLAMPFVGKAMSFVANMSEEAVFGGAWSQRKWCFPILEEDPFEGSRNRLALEHGERGMPIWGARYAEEDYQRYGTAFGGEDVVRGRILQLVYYLQSLQE